MTAIVMIHGAFNELWGPHEIAARWVPALRDGLWRVDATVDPSDVSICFYGDLFRRDPERGDDETWDATRAGVEDALVDLLGEDALDSLTELAGRQTAARTVDMFTAMALDPSLDKEVRRRLVDQLDGTRVLIAHSLGSVVAHEVLLQHPEIELDVLVTIGSPLGESPFETGGEWPGSVSRWVNVVAASDPVAEAGRIPARFGPRVEERLVDNGHRGHHPEPYLNSRAVGETVAAALRG